MTGSFFDGQMLEKKGIRQLKRTAYWEVCSPEEKVMKKNYKCPPLANNYSIGRNCDKTVMKIRTIC